MNCHIVQNNLSAYLDRELPGEQMLEVRSHVEHCGRCGEELEALRSVKSGLSSLPVFEPRAGFSEDVLQLVAAQGRQSARLPVGLMLATSIAAAVLAVLVFNAFFSPEPRRMADEGVRFDTASDSAVTSPDFGGHAPLMPVGR